MQASKQPKLLNEKNLAFLFPQSTGFTHLRPQALLGDAVGGV
jgi:hypothetical protein